MIRHLLRTVAWSACGIAIACGGGTSGSGGAAGGTSEAGTFSTGFGGMPRLTNDAGAGGAGVSARGAGGASGASGASGVGASGGSAAGAGGSAGAACTPIAHQRPVPGTLSKDFATISAAVSGIYLVSAYFEGSGACATMCAATAPGPYLLVRPQQTYLRACNCMSIADCQALAQQTYANGSYQVDFTSAKSDQILSGKSGYTLWPTPNNLCSGADYDVELIQTSSDTIRLDGDGVYVEVPPEHDAQTGLDGCFPSQIDSAVVGQTCNRVQVLDAQRVAPLP